MPTETQVTAMSLPILPDVLAYHVCPFLGNRERASMLQLCHAVRRDLFKRGVAGLVRYTVGAYRINLSDLSDADTFAYMQQHGTQRLTVLANISTFAPMIHKLDKLRELRIEGLLNSIPDIDSIDMPSSLEILHIECKLLFRGTIIINIDHLPNLRSLNIDATSVDTTFVANTQPPFLAELTIHVCTLKTTRADAANILMGSKLTHIDMYIVLSIESDINQVFDGLDAPALKSFSSRGSSTTHTYDLRAPQLRVVHHSMYSCLPKSAPNITHVHTTYYNIGQYEHLTKLTHLNIEIQGGPLVYYIDDLPPQLEELCISGSHRVVHVACAPPKTLKLIELLNGCNLVIMSEYTGAIVREPAK
jgi:hypothetical protein